MTGSPQHHTWNNLCISLTLRPKTWTDCRGPLAGMFLKHTEGKRQIRNQQIDGVFCYFTGTGRETYRLQLGCRTERPTGFHTQNIRGRRTTLFACFVAGFATVAFALPPSYSECSIVRGHDGFKWLRSVLLYLVQN